MTKKPSLPENEKILKVLDEILKTSQYLLAIKLYEGGLNTSKVAKKIRTHTSKTGDMLRGLKFGETNPAAKDEKSSKKKVRTKTNP